MENERASLFAELEGLRKMGEKRANALENEVSTLRKEVTTLEELLYAKKKIPSKEVQDINSLHRNLASSQAVE